MLVKKAAAQAVSAIESLVARGIVNVSPGSLGDRTTPFDYDTPDYRTHWTATLTRNGLRVLGAGAYGLVVEYKGLPGYVIKIAPCAEDGYPVFARWVRENRSKLPPEQAAHLPDIIHAEPYSGVFIAIIERLGMSYNDAQWQLPGDKLRLCEQQVSDIKQYRNDRELQPAYKLGAALESARIMLGRGSDMHGGNFMLRGDTPVVTDPWI